MPIPRHCLSFLLSCAFSLLSFSALAQDDAVVLAVSTYPDPTYHDRALETTIDVLGQAIKPRKLQIVTADAPELAEIIHRRQADVVILNAGYYRQLAASGGLRDIATLLPPGFSDQNHCDGGAIVVRSDDVRIQSLADLKGMRLSANTHRGFNGFVVEMGEIARQGFDPDKFFSSIHFTGEGQRMSAAAIEVLNGQADAAFLRMCLLEHLEEAKLIPAGKLRVLEPYDEGEPLPCKRSTALYPSWVLATTPTATPELSRLITKTILNLPQAPNGFSWGLATDFSQVDELYKTLRLGTYEYLREEWSIKRFWQTYQNWIYGFLVLLAALGMHYTHSLWLVKTKTRELREALIEQQRLEREKLQAITRINSLQRAASLSQLSSLFVHELGQPLNALVCFCGGLMNSLTHRPSPKTMAEADLAILNRITQQAQRANDVLNKVRSYAKGKSDRSQKVDLGRVVQKVISDLHISAQQGMKVTVDCPYECFVIGSELEIEIILLNLVKNALDAAHAVPRPSVKLAVKPCEDGSTQITISDNGPEIDDKTLESLTRPLFTTKENGLGLGLSIVQSLCEAHRARLTFVRNCPTGLLVTITFPADLHA